jgi:hypothetical protein
MDIKLFATLLDPAVLFFFLGIFAALVRSNLEIPPPIAKFLSLYLLMAIGIKGGVALSVSGFHMQMLVGLAIALFMAFLVPLYTFPLLRRKLDGFNAAAIAATYGSVSAVTFIAAGQFLDNQGIAYGGYMAVALVIMEAPAVIMAVGLAAMTRASLAKHGTGATMANVGKHGGSFSLKNILHESFTDGAILLLMGSLLIGFIVGADGYKVMKPFTGDLFKGLLAFFLLEMGILVARRIREMKGVGPFLIAFAFLIPMLNAVIVITLSRLAGLSAGDTLMLAVLAASASYIVVPAVVRVAIPEANPGLYFGMALALTFPFNVVLGIPLYYQMITTFVSS